MFAQREKPYCRDKEKTLALCFLREFAVSCIAQPEKGTQNTL